MKQIILKINDEVKNAINNVHARSPYVAVNKTGIN
jgi:hypothetical protein